MQDVVEAEYVRECCQVVLADPNDDWDDSGDDDWWDDDAHAGYCDGCDEYCEALIDHVCPDCDRDSFVDDDIDGDLNLCAECEDDFNSDWDNWSLDDPEWT